MTAQIHDKVFHRDREFAIFGRIGSDLFKPQAHGIQPERLCTACWRGYFARYEVLDGQLFLTKLNIGLSDSDGYAARAGQGKLLFGRPPRCDRQEIGFIYDELRHPIPFSGSLLLNADFIRELLLKVHDRPVWAHRNVREVLFTQGHLTDDLDRSSAMQSLRERILQGGKQPFQQYDGSENIDEWISKYFPGHQSNS
ncbi:MAG: hypothetical protein IT581_08925 [Verrucomicrobiales bacterium]|nr:hypothetical protein [Verrucomicrobiales bacterium]